MKHTVTLKETYITEVDVITDSTDPKKIFKIAEKLFEENGRDNSFVTSSIMKFEDGEYVYNNIMI